MLNNYICALDIGSSKISAIVCQIKRKRIINIFLESIPIKSIKRGVIIDSIDLVSSISKCLRNLKIKSSINIKYICANISGQDIVTKHSRSIIPLAERGNKVITSYDIQKVNEQARILGSSLQEEIIHTIPFSYTIDSQSNISNPLGLYSHRLETDLYLVCAKLSSVQNISRVINQAGFEIKNLFFSGLATSRAIFNKELKEGLNILCDMGSDITELLIFKDGILRDIEILALGGNDLTKELEETLKIPFELAEDIKRSYGIITDSGLIKEDKEILVKKGNIYKPIKQRLVCEILGSCVRLMCQNIKETLEKKLDLTKVDNFVTCGRTILLEGFLEVLENTLGIPVKLARITEPEMVSLVNKDNNLSGQKYLTYLTCLGIICEVLKGTSTGILPTPSSTRNLFLKAINRVKEVYQEYF